MIQPPAFISFTGADSVDLIPGMQTLSEQYPVEWGILVDEDQAGETLFPSSETLRAFKAASGLRLAAHVCGKQARLIVNEPQKATISVAGFQRLQVNHGFEGASPDQVENAVWFGRQSGVRTMLQTISEFPSDLRLDWLYDVSFGTGKSPGGWPALPEQPPLCGYSGGIRPENVKDVLNAISAPAGAQYWIDMESGIRTDAAFDLLKCEEICRAVFEPSQRSL